MLSTCTEFANEHNLKFSVDSNAQKSKSKCMAFLKDNRILPNMKLNDFILPWVSKVKHLGTTLENCANMVTKDIYIKRAEYIANNNKLNQEFYYLNPHTKFFLNRIYNSHFTGSSLWNLFSKESVMIENCWNVSFRIMYALPRETHRFFVERITNFPHIKLCLLKRYINFIKSLENHHKLPSKNLFNPIQAGV